MKFDVILFDIDNVLVDTRASYLAAVQKTVETYLRKPEVVSLRDINNFKLLGGFNDDWDTCYGMILFLETALQGKPVRFGDHRRERLTISELGKRFPERPLSISGLEKHLRVLYGRITKPPYKKIAGIFQDIYWKKPALVKKEKLIFPKRVLQKIREKGIKLGIVTGRNRVEANYALKRFGIRDLFDALVTIDDVKRAEKKTGKMLRKPNPWPILECAKRFKKKNAGHFLYVGDLPDDVLAANRAKKFLKIKAAAFPLLSGNSDSLALEFRKAKPDFFLKKPADLLKILA